MKPQPENPPAESPATDRPTGRIEPGLKQTSIASTLSFVFGVCAMGTLVLVRPSLILSLPAILFGHIAKANLRKSKGELVGWGKARTGKLLGYVCLAVSLLLFFYLDDYRLLIRGAMESERTKVVNAQGQFSPGLLGEIERKLAAGDTTDFGNNETASRLATVFRRQLRSSLNAVLTHRDEKGIGLDTSGISCYCHASDSICFVASIADLNSYTGAANDVLIKAAWQSAVLAVRSTAADDAPETGSAPAVVKLAVGLMERSNTETVIIGSVDIHSNDRTAPNSVVADVDVLATFVNQSQR